MKTKAKSNVLHIEAQLLEEQNLNQKALNKLPKKLVLLYSIQYKPLAQRIKSYLKAKKSPTYYIYAFKQVLGCTKLTEKDKKYPILLIGSGRFHALNILDQTDEQVYIYNRTITKLSKDDKQMLEKRKQAALSKFLAADRIGILVSTKHGQNRLADAKALKKKLEKQRKKAYLFISNNINLQEIENFKLDLFVNTACPGLAFDSSQIINIDDLSSVKF